MWNEEENIRPSLDAARELCDDLCSRGTIRDYELVIVDDCSTDATGRMADALAARDGRIRVIHHDRNRQLGGALRTGLQAARGDVILYTDADLPCDLAEARRALRMMSYYGADIVSGYRNDRTGEGLRRTIYSHAYNGLVRLLFALPVRDVNFAFKLIRRSALETMRLRSEGSFIDAELLARAQRLGLRIVQIGVDYVPRMRGTSSLARPAVILRLLGELVRLYPEIMALEPSSATVVEVRRARATLRKAVSR
jgi:glycosyltransferase involved in cell wall biosynthesis